MLDSCRSVSRVASKSWRAANRGIDLAARFHCTLAMLNSVLERSRMPIGWRRIERLVGVYALEVEGGIVVVGRILGGRTYRKRST